jgi:long-chain-fatty-acid--CoA ligase ACSBG
MQVFREATDKFGDKPAMAIERGLAPVQGRVAPPALPLAEWDSRTYQQYYDECVTTGRAMISLGLEQFDGVNIYGFNAPEWFVGELGAIFAGGIAAGIYPSDTPDQVEYKSLHSGASIAVVDTMEKAKVFLDAAARLPKLKAVIVWDAALEEGTTEDHTVSDSRTVRVVRWAELATLAEATPEAELVERSAAQEPGHCCTYIYTSGTTGRPKAVMISHDQILFEAFNVLSIVPNGRAGEQERLISFLPLSHVAGMMLDIIAPICMAANGPGWCTVHFARPYDLKIGTVGDRLRCVKPTIFLGVPRVWEKIAEKMKAVGAQTKGLKKSIATWAKAKGLAHQRNCQLGGSGQKPWWHGWADALVLSKVKTALGLEECKFGFTGAAPITTDTLEYFGSLGIQINEVYGMSECTGATTFSTDAAHVWGSCGWAMAGMEVRVVKPGTGQQEECPRAKDLFAPTEEEQGEIVFRGRHIMLGYMANPDLGEEHVAEIEKKNAEAIDSEGWLHSGDKGCMDARGMVKITGRYKELIIGAGGENIAPVPIEDAIKRRCPGVSNVVMVGDKRKYNVAVVTLKAEGAEGEEPGTDKLAGGALALYAGQETTTISAAAGDAELVAAVQAAIDATNADPGVCTNNASRIQKWTIAPRDLSVVGGELTPTLKVKRGEVAKTYAAAIDAMYTSREKFVPFVPNPASGVGSAQAEVSQNS